MTIDAHLEQVKQSLVSDIEKGTDIVFKGLVENPPINSIPESLFVNYFLPCFTGQVIRENWVMEWVGIAGTPMSEVAVVQDGTRNILFKVPGILSSRNLFLNKQTGDLGDIFTRYEQINNNLPKAGIRFLSQALNQKSQEIMQNYSMDSTKQAWLYILQRYNLVSQQISQQTANVSTNDGDMFEY